jgi:ribonucleoside-diphosphate reductase alpha chain
MADMGPLARTTFLSKYSHLKDDGTQETWEECAFRVGKHVMRALGYRVNSPETKAIIQLIAERKFIPGGRYLATAGRPRHQTNNCITLRAEDSREGWADLLRKTTMALMTGAGVGVVYSDVRASGKLIRGSGTASTGPIALACMLNEVSRGIRGGGDRRGALWAGLAWDHPDVNKFIAAKDWSEDIRTLKAKDYNASAPLDGTNVSIILDNAFFKIYNDDKHSQHNQAHGVYWSVIRHMLQTGEPGFSVSLNGEELRNACTEVTSADDSDICNLGSVNLARVGDVGELAKVLDLSTLFLLAGSVYSDLPYPEVDRVRIKNRRIGVGLMGIHEWLLKRGLPYAPNDELWQWLQEYQRTTEYAKKWCKEHDLTAPKATRSIAPNGTTAIVAETIGGIEPLFCVAYKRRYLKGDQVAYQYVVDPTARRLIESGVAPGAIEDAYKLAENPEKRVAFQAWVQQAVDMAISSTINLPSWGSLCNNESRVAGFGNMLMKYLPKLKGITVYPDGGRSAQPLTPVSYEEAMKREGQEVIEEQFDVCSISGGTCGS